MVIQSGSEYTDGNLSASGSSLAKIRSVLVVVLMVFMLRRSDIHRSRCPASSLSHQQAIAPCGHAGESPMASKLVCCRPSVPSCPMASSAVLEMCSSSDLSSLVMAPTAEVHLR